MSRSPPPAPGEDELTAYPVLAAALPAPAQERLRLVVRAAAASARDGAIANADFLRAKDSANGALRKAWDSVKPVIRSFDPRSANPETREVAFLMAPMTYEVASHLKRVSALPDGPGRKELLEFLGEARRLADGIAAMKSVAVKRVPKPPEERVEGYVPPRVSSEAERKVVAALEQLTEGAFEELRESLARDLRGVLATFESALAAHPPGPGDRISDVMERHFAAAYPRLGRAAAEDMGAGAARDIGFLVLPRPRGRPFVIRPDAGAAMARAALDEANAIRTMFVHKNFRKLASVVEAKGCLERASVAGRNLCLGGLEGRLRFEFADGSSFEADNAVVTSTSVRGRRFNRFPLTFRAVRMPDGSAMPTPSEERMNEVFAAPPALPTPR